MAEATKDIEDVLKEEIKIYSVLYCKVTRRALRRPKHIQTCIMEIHTSVETKMEIKIPLQVIYEIWEDCLYEAILDLIKESHYSKDDLIDDTSEDLHLFNDLLIKENKKNVELRKGKVQQKSRNKIKSKPAKKGLGKTKTRHRVGRVTKLPLKQKDVVKHPQLDTFAQRKVQQQEALIEQFCELKEEFVKSNAKMLDTHESDFWPIICDKYQCIDPENYDKCTDEAVAIIEALLQD